MKLLHLLPSFGYHAAAKQVSLLGPALRGLTATRAATVQLAVPVLAALGGVGFLSEEISMRLAVAAALILGGVALAVVGRGAA